MKFGKRLKQKHNIFYRIIILIMFSYSLFLVFEKIFYYSFKTISYAIAFSAEQAKISELYNISPQNLNDFHNREVAVNAISISQSFFEKFTDNGFLLYSTILIFIPTILFVCINSKSKILKNTINIETLIQSQKKYNSSTLSLLDLIIEKVRKVFYKQKKMKILYDSSLDSIYFFSTLFNNYIILGNSSLMLAKDKPKLFMFSLHHELHHFLKKDPLLLSWLIGCVSIIFFLIPFYYIDHFNFIMFFISSGKHMLFFQFFSLIFIHILITYYMITLLLKTFISYIEQDADCFAYSKINCQIPVSNLQKLKFHLSPKERLAKVNSPNLSIDWSPIFFLFCLWINISIFADNYILIPKVALVLLGSLAVFDLLLFRTFIVKLKSTFFLFLYLINTILIYFFYESKIYPTISDKLQISFDHGDTLKIIIVASLSLAFFCITFYFRKNE